MPSRPTTSETWPAARPVLSSTTSIPAVEAPPSSSTRPRWLRHSSPTRSPAETPWARSTWAARSHEASRAAYVTSPRVSSTTATASGDRAAACRISRPEGTAANDTEAWPRTGGGGPRGGAHPGGDHQRTGGWWDVLNWGCGGGVRNWGGGRGSARRGTGRKKGKPPNPWVGESGRASESSRRAPGPSLASRTALTHDAVRAASRGEHASTGQD